MTLQIEDAETGESKIMNYGAYVRMPEGEPCPFGCKKEIFRCVCKDLSVFDAKGQLSRIFAKSNFHLLKNLNSLFSYKFLKSTPFWSLVAFALAFLVALILVNTFFKKINQVEKYHSMQLKTKIMTLTTVYKV